MEVNYQLKAMKYKMKYIDLKNQILESQDAGTPPKDNIITEIVTIIEKSKFIPTIEGIKLPEQLKTLKQDAKNAFLEITNNDPETNTDEILKRFKSDYSELESIGVVIEMYKIYKVRQAYLKVHPQVHPQVRPQVRISSPPAKLHQPTPPARPAPARQSAPPARPAPARQSAPPARTASPARSTSALTQPKKNRP
jgi:hypothetical protein